MSEKTRNGINHFVLNKLLVARYHVRKQPGLIRCLMIIELLLDKLGLISHEHRDLGPHNHVHNQ